MNTDSNSALLEAAPATVEIPADQLAATIPAETAALVATAPAPASKSKQKKDKPTSARVAEIRLAATALATVQLPGFEFKPFAKGDSFVLRVPSFKEAVKSLPQSRDAKAALALVRGLAEAVNALTGGPATATWVFHASGSFALYSRF